MQDYYVATYLPSYARALHGDAPFATTDKPADEVLAVALGVADAKNRKAPRTRRQWLAAIERWTTA